MSKRTLQQKAPSLRTAERRAKAVELRRQRMNFREIGEALGVTEATAYRLYQQALASAPVAHIEEHRREELTLIDDASRDLLAIATDPLVPARSRIEAYNALCKWAERKAKLMGLDAPEVSLVATLDVLEQQIIQAEAEVRARQARLSLPVRTPGASYSLTANMDAMPGVIDAEIVPQEAP